MKNSAWFTVPLALVGPILIFIVIGKNLNERVSPVIVFAVCLGLAAMSALVSAQPDVRTKVLGWGLFIAAVEASLLSFAV